MDGDPSVPAPALDIGTLKQFLDSLQSFSMDLIQHLQSGQTLCHYTSLDGLISIINNGDLWLTNTRFCNDDEEMLLGHKLVDELVDQLETEAAAGRTKDWFDRLRKKIKMARNDQVYVTCFCERDNLLSQWRGYADNGGGVSIEFDAPGFGQVAGPDCMHGLMRLWKVFYSGDQQRKIIRSCFDYPHWPPTSTDDNISYIVDALQFFMPTFKHPDFAAEEERRLIFTPNPNLAITPKFRTRRGMLVPYFSLRDLAGGGFPNGKLPIRRITVGPSYTRDLNVESVRTLLAQNGYVGIEVAKSTTPFRP